MTSAVTMAFSIIVLTMIYVAVYLLLASFVLWIVAFTMVKVFKPVFKFIKYKQHD